ncbi:activating transcription factor 7-interacting protein 2 isoform X1 [Mastomys coucha]|uniref:activating transcription factor 7-interacting protein 2 isoform X1 n=1 Tax=Mastomys coucha TaxID=35658 RepID=UPI001261F87C|nr:activating transcription factor 7-interacting protein 2 isoform X1 [Mastomys coucha]XP_031218191.1 activating transcription factor 7-interacting protein 2 isoform X1 [Mastomys coucha]XP_031218202.1 activating transcription factor 7-interacting protein 2 isoform X1 [Mastomys coucha]XP_031218206.1 activating transcription factor 7-interacting protein 2 isoform X1 [Mastomys coucha]
MESPDRKRQKVLKAKKTMPTSCRKQLEILSMSMNVEAPQTTVGTNIPNGHNPKMFSENKENVKVMKTSEQINENACEALERHTALLEQVKHWIRQEICMVNCNLFDKKLNELNERIGKTQCRSKHEAIAGELFVKIRRLQRRIKVLSSQRNCLEPNTLPSNTVCKVTDSEAVNLNVTQKSVKSRSKGMSSMNHSPLSSSEKASRKINLPSACVEFASESNTDDVMLISVENPNLKTSITSDPAEIRKNTSRNFSNSRNSMIKVGPVKKKFDFVIDLTREGLSNYTIESRSFTQKSTSKAVLRSKEIISVAENGNEGFDSFEHLPPLPEPPPPLPEMADKIQDTLPPQKPELKVKRVLGPTSVALTWNIPKVNPKCAPVESYHIFLYYENSSHLTWKKIAEIKALPLPMACTLSQILASTKYYFAVQSKDIFGRYGPFCNIKSIPGFPENLT